MKTYELATVTYGTASAPYLAMRTLQQLAEDEASHFPVASAVLKSDFYMDDVLTGSDSLTGAKKLQHELIDILKKGGMKLHKWCSNHPELTINLSEEYQFSNPEKIKALGIVWKPNSDTFSFEVKIEIDISYTKRQVLSTIARIFDPL